MNAPRFTPVDAGRLRQLAARFGDGGTRAIADIHVHVTGTPSIADFEALADQFGERPELAGQAICERVWRRHTIHRGWSHVGHHLLIDPGGRVWIGRPWDLPPVSVAGHNGNARSGPLCVSVVGDIGDGRESLSAPQRKVLVITLAGLCDGFDLTSDRLVSPASLGAESRHRGADALLQDVRSAVRDARKDASGKRSKGHARSPLAPSEDDVSCLLGCLLHDAAVSRKIHRRESACGLHDDLDAGEESLEHGRSRGAASTFSLTPSVDRKLKRHVVNLRQGEFSSTGDFCTTAADLEALVDRHLKEWIASRKTGGHTPRVLIYAHGGLNREEAGLAYAAWLTDWWLGNGIYPIFFVWETGLIESFVQLIEQKAGGNRRGFVDDAREAASEVRDTGVEALVRAIGQDFWTVMKTSARRASEKGPTNGAYQLASRLGELYRHHDDLEVHAAGTSAGAIFHAHFMTACDQVDHKVPVESLSLLAPACTVELFREHLLERIDGKRIKRLNLFNLDSVTERRDTTVPIYGKSLLHLVSNGFEGRRDTPVLGMEKSIDADPALARSLGLGADERPDINVVYSPTDADADASFRAAAISHGGLSRDPVTLVSLARLILPAAEAARVSAPAKARGGTRGPVDALFEPLSARVDAETHASVFGEVASPGPGAGRTRSDGSSPEHAATVSASGARTALCIGIDDYPGDDRLEGCAADAVAWQGALERLGFTAEVLLNEDATYDGILGRISRTVGAARAGDVVVIQYSGHGIQFPDTEGDEEDAQDEALVPVDSARRYFVSDDELWEALQSAADGVLLYVFMDCCHSRSNSRMYARATERPDRRSRKIVPTRSMIDAHRRRLLPRRQARGATLRPIEDMRHVKFAACLDREEAFEENGQGNFTRAALAVLRDLDAGMSNEAIRYAIERSFPPDARQHPGLECPTHMARQAFLGGIHHG